MTRTATYSGIDELESKIHRLAESLGGTVENVHERAERFEFSDEELSVFGRLKNLEWMYEIAQSRR